MIPRRLLFILVISLPVLVVSVAVVMAAHALLAATEDKPAVAAMRWVGTGLVLLTVVDLVLLVGALGIQSLGAREDQPDESDESGSVS